MELAPEQKKHLARLAICRQLYRRTADLCEMQLRAELRKIGRSGKRFDRADAVANAAHIELCDTLDTLAIIANGKTPDFTLVPDLADICNLHRLLPDLCPDSWELLEAVETMKPSHACRDGISMELLPAIPRPLPEFDPDDDSFYVRTADGFEKIDNLTAKAMLIEADEANHDADEQ